MLIQTQGYAHHAMFWNRFPTFCQPEVRGLFMWKYSGLLNFMSFSVWNFDSLCSLILISFMDLLWLVAVNLGETHGWQVSFPHLLQLCMSLSPESSSVFCHLRLIAAILHHVVRLSFNHLMYFTIKKVLIFY